MSSTQTHKPLRGLLNYRWRPAARDGAEVLRTALRSGLDMPAAWALLEDGEQLVGAFLVCLRILDRAAQLGAEPRLASNLDPELAAIMKLQGAARAAALAQLPTGSVALGTTLVTRVAGAYAQWLLKRDGDLPDVDLTDSTSTQASSPQRVDVVLKWPEGGLQWPQGAVPVDIVSTPKTVATSKVVRDSAGRIVATEIVTEQAAS
jgi:hypothetical protein